MDARAGLKQGTVYRLVHRTTYTYERAVQLGPQWVRLRPLPDPRAAPPVYALEVDPPPLACHWLTDTLGNVVARLVLPAAVERLSLVVRLELDLAPRNPFDFVLMPHAAQWPFSYEPADADALLLYRRAELEGPLLSGLREAAPQDTVALVLGLAARVRDAVAYITRLEQGVWLTERTLSEARGSCRDSAWVLVQLLRLHGIAARFVSGYLVQLPGPDGDGPAAPAAELHAWADAYLPGAGWVGLDATSGLLTAEGHVALAASPDPLGAAPLEGTVEPGEVRLETSIEVGPLRS